MTSRERVRAALQHREPDRTPIFEYVLLSPVADGLLGRRYGGDKAHWREMVDELGWSGALDRSIVDRLDMAELLGHDMLYVGPNPPERPAGSPSAIEDKSANGGPVAAMVRRNGVASGAPAPGSDTFEIYGRLGREMERRGLDLPIMAAAYGHGVWTDVDLMQTMVLEPEVAHRHFELATERSLALIETYLELGIDQVGVGGDFAGTKLIISPGAYQTFIVPEVRKLSRRIHAGDGYAVNASDGDLWPVLEDFLFGCEVDGYLEIDMHAGMDMAELKARCGDRITLYGNLDCGNILSFGSPQEVGAHTRSCLEAGMGSGGHILCASNAIAASVSVENYLAVVNAHRDMFGLPKLVL